MAQEAGTERAQRNNASKKDNGVFITGISDPAAKKLARAIAEALAQPLAAAIVKALDESPESSQNEDEVDMDIHETPQSGFDLKAFATSLGKEIVTAVREANKSSGNAVPPKMKNQDQPGLLDKIRGRKLE